MTKYIVKVVRTMVDTFHLEVESPDGPAACAKAEHLLRHGFIAIAVSKEEPAFATSMLEQLGEAQITSVVWGSPHTTARNVVLVDCHPSNALKDGDIIALAERLRKLGYESYQRWRPSQSSVCFRCKGRKREGTADFNANELAMLMAPREDPTR